MSPRSRAWYALAGAAGVVASIAVVEYVPRPSPPDPLPAAATSVRAVAAPVASPGRSVSIGCLQATVDRDGGVGVATAGRARATWHGVARDAAALTVALTGATGAHFAYAAAPPTAPLAGSGAALAVAGIAAVRGDEVRPGVVVVGALGAAGALHRVGDSVAAALPPGTTTLIIAEPRRTLAPQAAWPQGVAVRWVRRVEDAYWHATGVRLAPVTPAEVQAARRQLAAANALLPLVALPPLLGGCR